MLKVSKNECVRMNEKVRICSGNEGLHIPAKRDVIEHYYLNTNLLMMKKSNLCRRGPVRRRCPSTLNYKVIYS